MGHNPIFATLKILVGKSYAPWLSDFIKYWENRRFFGIFGPTYVVRNDLSYILIYHNPTFGDFDDLEFLRVEGYEAWISAITPKLAKTGTFLVFGNG